MSTDKPPSEEELRAAYEAEIKRIRVEQILLDQIVSLVNLGMRRTGLAPGTEDERDLAQVKVAIEAVRALLPLVEQVAPPQATPIRDALSQLQLAFVRLGGTSEAPRPAGGGEPGGGGPGAGPGAGGEPESAGGGPEGAGGGPEGGRPDGGGGPSPGGGPAPGAARDAPKPGEPGPAQRSGRLWVPGQ